MESEYPTEDFPMCRLLSMLCVVCLAAGCMDRRTTGTTGTASTAKQLPTREEFKSLVMGKTMEDVKAAFGKPARTNENGHWQVWTYEKVTRDSVSEKVDYSTAVWFDAEGKVGKVTF